MGTSYDVSINYKTNGDFASQMSKGGDAISKAADASGKLHASWAAFGSQMQSVGSKIMGPIDALADKAMSLGSMFAKLGAGGAMAAAIYGVKSVNNELEKTQISMAAIFNANGASASIGGGMSLAKEQMDKMRKDAAELPGEFQDLANIMKTVAVPGMKAGMNPDELRAMSSKLMATGAVAGLPMDMVAREAAQLIEGRSGAHNVLGMRLAGLSGQKAEEFNSKSPQERLKQLQGELDKFGPAIELYKNSFDGLSSTLVDNAKRFLGQATEPLFDKVKGTLKEANKWFDDHEDTTKAWAQTIGAEFSRAFDYGKEKLTEWGPIVFNFTDKAYTEMVAIWVKIEPYVEKVAGHIKSFLSNKDAIDRLESAAKLYAGLKVTQAAGGGFMDVAKVAGSVAPLVGGAGGAGAVGEGAAAALGAAAAPAAIAVGALAGAVHSVADESSVWHGVAVENWKELQENGSKTLDNLKTAGYGAINALMPVVDTLGVGLLGAANIAVFALEKVSDLLENTIGKLNPHIDGLEDHDPTEEDAKRAKGIKIHDTRTLAEKAEADEGFALIRKGIETIGKDPVGDALKRYTAQANKDEQAKHPGTPPMSIQKVEIVVTSNQSPSRIAREVEDRLANVRRHPKVSPYVPNWAASGG